MWFFTFVWATEPAAVPPSPQTRCGGLGALAEGAAAPLFGGPAHVTLPAGAEPNRLTGDIWAVWDVQDAPGVVALQLWGYAVVKTTWPADGSTGPLARLYEVAQPGSRLTTDPVVPHRYWIEAPKGLVMENLEQVTVVADSRPGAQMVTYTAFVRQDLLRADPEGCRAVARQWAATLVTP